MNNYHGNNRPYVYVVSNKDDFSYDILKILDDNNITLCIGKSFNRKEKKYIEAAYGVLLIIDKELISNSDFRKVIDIAVYNNKNILCVYKEEVELDAVLSMQLNPQQSILAYQYENKEELFGRMLKAVIFRDMKITSEQKKFQRNRSLIMIIVPIISALVIFATIIYPLMIVPAQQEEAVKEQFGLAGLSDEDLAKITSLHIVGNKVFANPNEINKISINYSSDPRYVSYEVEKIGDNDEWYWGDSGEAEIGTIEDISILRKMPNLTNLTIAAENISDISPIFELKKLRELVIDNNPIESLEGIENCTSLERIEFRNTFVSDISPLFKLPKLWGLMAGNCVYLTDISGVENTQIKDYELWGTGIKEIKHLPKRDFVVLNLVPTGNMKNFSFLEDPLSYDWLAINGVDINDLKSHLDKITVNGTFYFNSHSTIRRLDELNGLTLTGSLWLENCYELYTLYGFGAMFPDVREVTLQHCYNINDLSPLLEGDIKTLTITEDLEYLITDEFNEKGIEVIVEREN